MIGVVLCAHHRLGEALLEAAQMIVGEFSQVASVAVMPGDDMEPLLAQISAAITKVDTGSGVVVLCDMFGGTPSNLSISFLGDQVEIVTGVNLPMLLKLFTCRGQMSLPEVATTISSHGCQNILVAGELLQKRRPE